MYTTWPGCRYQTVKSSKFSRQFQLAALRVLLHNAPQALKESPDDCDRTFFNDTKFNRFIVLLSSFLTLIERQTDSNSVFNTLLPHPLDQNH